MPIAKYLTPLCHQVWPSEEMLPEIIGIPILFLSGLQDEIVPYVVIIVFQRIETDARQACAYEATF